MQALFEDNMYCSCLQLRKSMYQMYVSLIVELLACESVCLFDDDDDEREEDAMLVARPARDSGLSPLAAAPHGTRVTGPSHLAAHSL